MRLHKLVRRSFTMVELMAAMVIIAILAGIGVKGMQFANQAAAEGATKANMEKVKIFLEDFKKLKGYYPQKSATGVPDSSDDTYHLKIELASSDSTKANYLTSNNDSSELYTVIQNYTDLINSGLIERSTTDESASGAGDGTDSFKFMDGYGGYFYYACPGIVNVSSYDLISAGSDGYFQYENATEYNPDGKNSDTQANWDNITSWQ